MLGVSDLHPSRKTALPLSPLQGWLKRSQEPVSAYRPLYNATGLLVRKHTMFLEEIEGWLEPQFAGKKSTRRGLPQSRKARPPSVRAVGVARERELVTLAFMGLSFLSVVACRQACRGDSATGRCEAAVEATTATPPGRRDNYIGFRPSQGRYLACHALSWLTLKSVWM